MLVGQVRLVRLEVFDVLVVLGARVGKHPVARFAAPKRAVDGPRTGEEDRILERDRPLDGIGIDLPESFGQTQSGAVFVSCRIEPAAFVDAHGIDHERVAIPAADRVP